MTNAEARFNKIHIRKVYACLAVTCHLHFWQNDRDFLRATVVTRGWNGYRNKSQHRKSTLEKKILSPFQQGFEPATFQSRVRCSNHWAIPAPSLDSIRLKCFRDALIRFRLGISDINVHKNRYKASDLPTGNDCPFCPGVEENECRLCFKCSVYNDIRPDVMKNVEPY